MSDDEINKIIQRVDEALAIFSQTPGPLPAQQVSVKSMLSALRAQLLNELRTRQLVE